jgi:hypothetical protein
MEEGGAVSIEFRAARIELARHDWGSFRAPLHGGPPVPEIFSRMLDGGNANESIGYSLDERLETQSMVYEIALAATGVILAAFAGGRLAQWVEDEFITALHNILYGEPHHTELDLGNDDLVDRCVEKARDGVWGMYASLRKSNALWMIDMLRLVDRDQDRVTAFEAAYDKTRRAGCTATQ